VRRVTGTLNRGCLVTRGEGAPAGLVAGRVDFAIVLFCDVVLSATQACRSRAGVQWLRKFAMQCVFRRIRVAHGPRGAFKNLDSVWLLTR
jgi:hypothetical protein